ncbi:hypothetical protein [Bradyrhizobium sp.]|uniref:hypothetical protein n=1 Tax=Bradyrhizobium sp. TaxID=376 RepID=UPI00345B935A
MIAQTLAFVQSVKGKTEDFPKAEQPSVAPPSSSESATLAAVEYVLEARPSAPSAPRSPPPEIRIHSPNVASEVAAEVRDRISSFRKHQERFRREREEYFSTTLAKVRAAIHEVPPPRSEN